MNYRSKVRYSKLALGLAIALASAPAMAQQTSANVGGRITTAEQAVVAGAQVTITHVPSGTVSQAVTDANGRYAARGLRVGGPYIVTITKDGKTETVENVFLKLGEATQVDASFSVAADTVLEVVEVTASNFGSEVFSATAIGAGTTVTSDQISALPTIERSIQDFMRLDPRAVQTDKSRNEISIGGQNPRYNAIRVDGISTNDSFGLESNSLPTPRQPFSLDTIEEISVNVAAYDVAISGGVGGVINAVTKSGTNELKGSVYGLYRDNGMVRENTNGTPFSGFEDEQTYGFTLGGPIVKDKLFFFLNYEKFEQGAPGPSFGPVGSSASNIVNVTQANIDAIRSIASGYGFDAGSFSIAGADTTSEEVGLKIDWNINESHRMNLRYGKSDQSVANYPGFGTNSIALSTHAYQRDFGFDTYNIQLFSDWNEVFSTEAKVSYRDYSAVRTPVVNLPAIAVRVGNATVNFGTEENTHANILQTETWNAFFAGNLFLGDHEVKFGLEYENNDIYNLFGRRSNGVYSFDSIDDFRNGVSSRYQLFYPAAGNINNTAAVWGIETMGLFVQDTWFVNSNLTLTVGLRYDEPMVGDDPTYNSAAQAAFGFDNSKTIDGNGLFQPRVGFNYTFDSERRTQLRGGMGLFQGAAANVWLSNPFTNTGFGYIDYLFGSGITQFDPDPADQIDLIPAGARGGTQSIDFVDPDLGQPSVWKANLAFDHELPWMGLVASAELVLTDVKEAIFYQQLNLGSATAFGQDGRALYYNAQGLDPRCWLANGNNVATAAAVATGCARANPPTRTNPNVTYSSNAQNRFNRNRGFTDAIIARPTSKGGSEQLSLSLEKPFSAESNWYWRAAYTYTNATEVSPLTSSTSGSQWGNINTFNPNEEVEATSAYEIKDRISGVVSWRKDFFGDNTTTVSMFFEGRSGRPYSYVFDNDANGDGRFGNDLLYVPVGPGDVLFGSAAEEAAFWAYVGGDDYLNANRGRVVERNGARASWVNQFDLRISQEIPGFREGDKAEISLDILNVGNLLNKDWGRIEEIPFPINRGIVEFGGVDAATGKYVYRFNTPDDFRLYDDRGISRWSAQIGFRYRF